MKTKLFGIFIMTLLIGITLPSFGTMSEKQIDTACNSQESRIEWTKTYGGSEFDFLSSIITTQDGGFLLGGKTYTWSNGIGDTWLIKTDSEGNEIWNTSFGGFGVEAGPDELFELDDGSFIIPSDTESFGSGDFDFWLIKIDSNGNMMLNKTYGGKGLDFISFSITNREDYFFVGATSSYGAGSFDAWLLKTDSEGNEIWNKTYGGLGDEWCFHICPVNDGGFVLCGEKYVPNEICWLFKIDADGNMIWEKTYEPKIGHSQALQVIQTDDGGFIILTNTNILRLGNIWLGKGDIGLIKTDDQGNKLWEKTIGKFLFEDQGYDLLSTNDNGYIITGLTRGFGRFIFQNRNFPPLKQACIIKTDINGTVEWEETVGNGFCFRAIEINDSIFVVAGITQPGRSWDGTLIKIV